MSSSIATSVSWNAESVLGTTDDVLPYAHHVRLPTSVSLESNVDTTTDQLQGTVRSSVASEPMYSVVVPRLVGVGSSTACPGS